ncbi:MmcQ/YjbR family DNA-binding protein [Kribbella sp. NBC_01245]|uniref:MmcQ/YjbR family DNA-binding protein n=1 Tax=Kribbella sp. NBC_01245 TaxID=2903578 RepID=UPI002E2D7151|nr:MmcQ/YjbR family DNA-binding protein [Kribbella sp. NBC_01245]
MATQENVRRIVAELPETVEAADRFAFSVRVGAKEKGLAWVWLERLEPKQARVPQPEVLAVRVANGDEKAALLQADPDKFFTEDHYNGYPAVLVRLKAIGVAELRELLVDAWRVQAPRKLVKEYDAKT